MNLVIDGDVGEGFSGGIVYQIDVDLAELAKEVQRLLHREAPGAASPARAPVAARRRLPSSKLWSVVPTFVLALVVLAFACGLRVDRVERRCCLHAPEGVVPRFGISS